MQSQQLLKVAHQLIETANLLIKAASEAPPQTIVEACDRDFGQAMEDAARPSTHSKFTSKAGKVRELNDKLAAAEKELVNAKNGEQKIVAQRKITALRGHLTKTMNGNGGGSWKSQV